MELNKYREVTVSGIGESGDVAPMYLEAKGTSYNSTDKGAGYIKYRTLGGEYKTVTANTRGITLCMFDGRSMELLQTYKFDTYGVVAKAEELGALLQEIINGQNGQVIYAMVSFDAINPSEGLAEAMRINRAYHYFQIPGWGNLGLEHRSPYAAIGTSHLGIIKEAARPNTVGTSPAIVSAHIPADWDAIGSEGYGPDLLSKSRMQEFSYTGTGYSFAHGAHLTVPESGAYAIADGEYVRMTGQRKISLDRAYTSGYVRSYFWTASNSDGWIRSSSSGSYSVEWEEFELYFKWDRAADTRSGNNTGGASADYLRMGHYHYPSNQDVGTSYVRNIQVQKCGFSPNRDKDATVTSDSGIDGKNLIESPAAFNLLDPDTYYSIWSSSRNLTGRPNLGDSKMGSGFDTTTDTVKWFDKVLSNRNEYSIHEGKNFSGDSNRYNDIGYVSINPDKMYLACIWHYCIEKQDGGGRNYLGTHTLNESGSRVATYRAYDSYGTTNPYCAYPEGRDIEKGTWQLWSYWFLPKWYTNEEGLDFYNKHWSKWAGNYENARAGNSNVGNAPTYNPYVNGGNVRVARFRDGDAKIHLRWLDYYNTSTQNTGHHKTWWALPGIFEVDPLNLKNNGDIFPFTIKEE